MIHDESLLINGVVAGKETIKISQLRDTVLI